MRILYDLDKSVGGWSITDPRVDISKSLSHTVNSQCEYTVDIGISSYSTRINIKHHLMEL
jgi:hypothetical protein